jgi:hypothetical protein
VPRPVPSLAQIAAVAGVSKATASKALAVIPGRYRVLPATVDRVRQAAAALGWRRPVAQRHGRIALVHGEAMPLVDGVNGPLHNALVDRCIAAGHRATRDPSTGR